MKTKLILFAILISIQSMTAQEYQTVEEDKEEENTTEDEISSEQIVTKYITTIGGEKNITKIKTLRKKFQINNFDEDGNLTYTSYQEHTYISPYEFINKSTLNSKETYILSLKGIAYMKKGKKWKANSSTAHSSFSKQTSYIQDYSYLVNNYELIFDGIKMIDNIECYKIIVPKKEFTESSGDLLTMKQTFSFIKYYNLETGLLYMEELNWEMMMDYKDNKYIKDSFVKSFIVSKFLDYREVDGVLFPFKVSKNIKIDDLPETIQEEIYTAIEVNPTINPDDFKVD